MRGLIWLLAGLLLCVLLIGVVLDPASSAKLSATPTTAPTQPASRKSAETPESNPAWEMPEILGSSKLVRRLYAGTILNETAEQFRSGGMKTAEVKARLIHLRPMMLHADRWDGRVRNVARSLSDLTDPPRDLDSVRLVNKISDSPLGTKLPFRLWTRGDNYPLNEIRAARDNLEYVADICGASLEGGFDVLATPQLGSEIFPRQTRVRAAGVYYLDDRYCVVRLNLPPEFRLEVIKHELMHALHHRIMKGRRPSRFVSEGLAEYLRHCRPGDNGLSVPPARMARTLAALYARIRALRAAGAPIDAIHPQSFTVLKPRQFYALGGFGYLLAMATMAYVGGPVIEQALAQGRHDVLEDAIREIRWFDFVKFLKKYTGRGRTLGLLDPIVVADAGSVSNQHAEKHRWLRSEEATRDAFRALGVKLPPAMQVGRRLMDVRDGPTILSRSRVEKVLNSIVGSSSQPVLLLVDLSKAMDRKRELGWRLPASLEPYRLRFPVETPRAFVGAMAGILQDLTGNAPELVAMTEAAQTLSIDEIDQTQTFGFLGLRRRLTGKTARNIVFCLASSVEPEAFDETVSLYLKQLAGLKVRPSEVLVIDLATDLTHAMALAEAFASVSTEQSVAYWNVRLFSLD